MSSNLDFGPIFTSNGALLQNDYALKAANGGDTALGIRSSRGVLLAVEKTVPVLHNPVYSLKKVTKNIFMSYSGILSDVYYVLEHIQEEMHEIMMSGRITEEKYKNELSKIMHECTVYMGLRPIGCSFMSGIQTETGYHLLVTQPSSLSRFYKAYATGKNASRAKTELEKLPEELDTHEMEENAARILNLCKNPHSDNTRYTIEMAYISGDTGNQFVRVSEERIEELMEKYKDINLQ